MLYILFQFSETISTNLIVNANAVTPSSQCLVDQFSVTNPGGDAPPIICGQNSGEHSKEYC